MRSCIYGAGSLGTILGAYVTENGGQIDLINRNKLHTAALKEKGAHIVGTVDKLVKVNALYPDEMEGKYDVILLMTKQLFNEEVVTSLKPFLSENGVICTLQNGIPEPLIASIIGNNRTLGCTVEWGATLLEPGTAELTSQPDAMLFHLGRLEGVTDEQLNNVKSILEKMCPVEIDKNLIGARWSKLFINAVFSGLATVVGGTFGDISEGKKEKQVALRVMKECIDVGRANGVTFEPIQGKDLTKLFYWDNSAKRAFLTMLLPVAMKKHRKLVPSMLQDIRKNKPCEINSINGVVCEYGKKAGVPTPFNDKIVEIITKIEKGELKPEAKNIELFNELM